MDINLLKPAEVDLLFRYPTGRASRLAKAGKLPYVLLPDGEIRFIESEIEALLKPYPRKECIA
jgi:predicted site-specific integrase-resolvase